MWSIGEFARLGGVSVRMLRHYDSLGLIVPAEVDAVTGYRRYRAGQLSRLNRLVALKELGFSLEQTRGILDADPAPAELRGMLTLLQAQVSAQIAADRVRLAEIERRLRSIEKEGQMPEQEFTRKSLPALRVAQIQATVAAQEEIGSTIGPMFDRLAGALSRAGVPLSDPAIAWYAGDDSGGLRIAAAFPTATTELPDGVESADIEAEANAVTLVHHGSMGTVGDSWQALARYVEEQGLTSTGRAREVYLATPMQTPEDWVTELQQPVS